MYTVLQNYHKSDRMTGLFHEYQKFGISLEIMESTVFPPKL